MQSGHLGRRGFLLATCGVTTVVLAAINRPKPAQAFSLEEMNPKSAVGVAFANRCSTSAQGHADILAKLQAQLATMTGVKGTYIYDTAVCPFCGCPVTASRLIE